jgi:hypothetical protein
VTRSGGRDPSRPGDTIGVVEWRIGALKALLERGTSERHEMQTGGRARPLEQRPVFAPIDPIRAQTDAKMARLLP